MNTRLLRNLKYFDRIRLKSLIINNNKEKNKMRTLANSRANKTRACLISSAEEMNYEIKDLEELVTFATTMQDLLHSDLTVSCVKTINIHQNKEKEKAQCF